MIAVLNNDGIIISASEDFKKFFDISDNLNEYIGNLLNIDLRNLNFDKTDIFYKNISTKTNHKTNVHIHILKDPQKNPLALILKLDIYQNERAIKIDNDNLFHIDRLTHIGKLASGIAHEIGNPLGGILAAAYGLKSKLKEKDQIEYVNMIIEDISSIKNTIESLRDFARRSKPVFNKIDLKNIVERTFMLVKPELEKKNINLHINIQTDDTEIYADAEQLRQVFLNLILNSIQASKESGIITFSIREKNTDNKHYFEIVCKDNGCGMDENELSNIFKPFFTTKAKGLGLGLCVTKKIIDDHEGNINVESEKNKGTTFRILLPKEQL